MYAYYESMGDKRSLQKVAEKFNKSRPSIALIARAFKWAERIDAVHKKAARDPLIAEQKPRIDSTRKKLIKVVEEVSDTLSEMADISRKIKKDGLQIDGHLSPELQEKVGRCSAALSVWGFEWKSPKDLRALIQTLKEVKDFTEEPGGKSAPTNATQINTEKFELHIKD